MRVERSKDLNLENTCSRLIAAGALRESEIENIAMREELFAGVLKRIEASVEAPSPTVFGFSKFVRRHELGLGGAMAAAICVGVLGLFLQQRSVEFAERQVIPVPPVVQQGIRPAEPVKMIAVPTGQGIEPDAPTTDPAALPERAVPERAVFRQARAESPVRPQRASAEPAAEPEFYPVTYTGDNGESARGGRVIRVDVPRSTLFAMGLDVPLENESPTVKADLIVGPDGVTRAIRLVE